MHLKIEVPFGENIHNACAYAAKIADEENQEVEFQFNGVNVIVSPKEKVTDVIARWQVDFEANAKAYRESQEYKERETKYVAEEKARREAHLVETATTEEQMRDTKTPWPVTKEQLAEYVDSLVNRAHDYGTCVYAMSLAATAAFNYVAHELGTTGFQSSCADLDILRRTRSIKGPFILVKAEDALYPQSDPRKKLEEAMVVWQEWLHEEAKKKIAETGQAHQAVMAHWKLLAK